MTTNTNPADAEFPAGCVIKNIKQGTGGRADIIYAHLYDPAGELLIVATLDYILRRLEAGRISSKEE